MTTSAIEMPTLSATPFRETKWCTGIALSAEDGIVTLALVLMVLLPLAEAFLRRTFGVFIPASTAIVQNMVLVVGMLGGAIAAREGRLLCLSTVGETSLRGRLKNASRIFTSGVSAAVSGVLGLAA
jgi:C4-dicarboxylate transporter, DctM subunit